MNKYISRLTSSARGETFNPLIYPFLLTTFTYGLGFLIPMKAIVGKSFLFATMSAISPTLPIVWGAIAMLTVVMGITFLLFNIPPAGTYSGLLGFMVWFFVAILYSIGGDWLVMIAIALPNAFFWIWQYLSLSRFRKEDKIDKGTMDSYDSGGYDDELNPKDSKIDREHNRGVDLQD